jgi:hypothetical protein
MKESEYVGVSMSKVKGAVEKRHVIKRREKEDRKR